VRIVKIECTEGENANKPTAERSTFGDLICLLTVSDLIFSRLPKLESQMKNKVEPKVEDVMAGMKNLVRIRTTGKYGC